MGVSPSTAAATRNTRTTGRSRPGDYAASIRRHFTGSIDPVRVAPMYRISAALVVGAMILLPMLYVALVAAVLTAGVWWAIAGPGILFTDARGIAWRIVLYGGPLIIAGILVLFMIKPLFARRQRHVNLYSIERHQEPVLFAFIEQIARSINAPVPYQIDIAPEANAGAYAHKGLYGLLTGRLNLQIGMPLFAGMNTRQLAGVIAHELGHFSQHSGLRLTYIARSINNWFCSVVYQRDRLDDWLIERSHEGFGRGWGAGIFLAARPCVALVRGVLFVFMVISDAICSALLRQMEFNADQYEVRLAGTAAFEQTMQRLKRLSAAEFSVMAQLHDAAAERRLVDNLPALIAATAEKISEEMLGPTEPAGWRALFSTHPGLGARLRRATRTPTEGVFTLEQPASKLLRHYQVIGRWVTAGVYEQTLGSMPPADALVPVDRVVRRAEVERHGYEAHLKYYFGLLHPNLLLIPSPKPLTTPVNPKQAIDILRAAPEKLNRAREQIETLVKQFDKIVEVQHDIIAARALLTIGIKIKAKSFGLQRGTLDAAREASARNAQKKDELRRELEPHRKLIKARLSAALALLNCDAVREQLDHPDRMIRHALRLIGALQDMKEATDLVDQLRAVFTKLRVVYANAEATAEPDRLVELFQATERDGRQLLERLRHLLDTRPYPLQSDDRELSIGGFLTATSGGESSVIERISDAGSRFDQLYFRIMGRLALMATRVEQAALKVDPAQLPAVTVVRARDAMPDSSGATAAGGAPPAKPGAAPYRLEGGPA